MSEWLGRGGGPDEAGFQYLLQPTLTAIIDPSALRDYPHGVKKNYVVLSSQLWNLAPQVFLDNNWRDLSQPKVDLCFFIAKDQSISAEGSPLHTISKEVNSDDSLEVAKLLSSTALAGILSDAKLRTVSEHQRTRALDQTNTAYKKPSYKLVPMISHVSFPVATFPPGHFILSPSSRSNSGSPTYESRETKSSMLQCSK